MRLIDADALQDSIRKSAPVIPEFSRFYTRDRVDFEIAIAPEIDAVPVRHGFWKSDGKKWTCSECGEVDVYAYCWQHDDNKLHLQDKYCPACGCEMATRSQTDYEDS